MKLNIHEVVAVVLIFAISSFGADKMKSNELELRMSLGNAPGVEELDLDGAGTSSLDDDGGGELDFLVVNRFWASEDAPVCGVLGGGIFFAGHSGTVGSNKVDLSAFGLMAQGGLAARAADFVVFEFGPYLGIGVAEQEITGFSDGRGAYVMYGLKGGAFFSLGSNIELGLEVGYGGFANNVEFDVGGGLTQDGTFTGDGAKAAVVLSVVL